MSLTIRHYIHLWRDEEDFPEFTSNIKESILKAMNEEDVFFNFIDEYEQSDGEIETQQIMHIADHLVHYTRLYQQTLIHPLFKGVFSHEHVGINKKLRDFCEERIKTHPTLNIQKSIKEKDFLKKTEIANKAFYFFLENEFLEVVKEACDEFDWKNIFNFKFPNNPKRKKCKNEKRRDAIINFAIKQVWEKRILYSWMNNWDTSNYDRWIKDPVKEFKSAKDRIAEIWIKYRLWDVEMGNAHFYIHQAFLENYTKRLQFYQENFFSQLIQKVTPGAVITQQKNNVFKTLSWFDQIKHIFWGEYIGQCVSSYMWLIKERWADPKKMRVSSKDYLFPPTKR